MFFFFSKILLIFILPFSWILALLIAALFVKKPPLKRRLLIISIALSLVFTNPFLFNLFASHWDIKPAPLTKKGPYSCVIVLGGFSGEDGKGQGHFNESADRFIQGLKLYTAGRATRIFISGGNGNLVRDKYNYAEADWVKTQLQQLKVPDSCILTEDQSRNTIENAAFAKPVLEKNHLQPPYILVTSAFHMRRSLGIFKKANIDVVPYPCNYMTVNENFSMNQFIPDGEIIGNWNFYIKELVGTTVNIFK
jgi:uncharacterized SAM-binding protein YcdF (DUF218 family)